MSQIDTISEDEMASIGLCSVETIRRHLRAGRIAGTRVGRRWVVLREEYLAFIQRGSAANVREVSVVVTPPPAKKIGRRRPLLNFDSVEAVS